MPVHLLSFSHVWPQLLITMWSSRIQSSPHSQQLKDLIAQGSIAGLLCLAIIEMASRSSWLWLNWDPLPGCSPPVFLSCRFQYLCMCLWCSSFCPLHCFSERCQESYSDGPERFGRPLCEDQNSARWERQVQTEDEDSQGLLEPDLEWDVCVVSAIRRHSW